MEFVRAVSLTQIYGAVVQYHREKRGFTRAELAKHMRTAEANLGRIEVGYTTLHAIHLLDMALPLGLDEWEVAYHATMVLRRLARRHQGQIKFLKKRLRSAAPPGLHLIGARELSLTVAEVMNDIEREDQTLKPIEEPIGISWLILTE